MNEIWSSTEVEKATNGKISGEWSACKICIDSRNIIKGDLFIALKGVSDGHNYIRQALDNGASAVLIDHIPDNMMRDFNYCLVGDTIAALNDLALYNRARLDCKVIAITGSVGKTTTKEMLKVAFEPFGKVFANYGNYNNDLGVPLSIANTEIDTEYAIYEVGMNHAGEITPLVKMIKPDIVAITNVEPAHLEFFDSVEDIARAKAEIFLGLVQDGGAILNADNEWYKFLVKEAHKAGVKNIISFGKDSKADIKLLSYQKESMNSSKIELNVMGEKISYKLNIDAIHLAMASLVAMAALKFLNCEIKTATNNLIKFFPAKGRGQIFKLNFENKQITLINDSYNASPASVKAAIKSLGEKNGGRRLAIISDMRELGEKSIFFHEALLNDVIDNNISKVITIGKYMKYLYDILPEDKKLNHYQNTHDVIENISNHIESEDMILIKGSFGTEIYKLAEYIINKAEESR